MRRVPLLGTNKLVAAFAALYLAAAPAHAASRKPPIRLTNHESGTTVRYPVPLLRGELTDASLKSVTVVNQSSKRDTREMKGLAHQGRFKALAELVPGENKLLIRAGKHTLPLTLTYTPQTNSHVVRIIYLTDKDGHTDYQTPLESDPQDFAAKLDTAMKLMQCFTAESLNDFGLGRRTFHLEFDGRGKVKVHVVRVDHDLAHLHTFDGGRLYSYAGQMIRKKLPRGKFKSLVIPAFTRLDSKTGKLYCHTALGGGNQALFGGGDLFAWPSRLADVQKAFLDARRVDPKKIFSDSVGRHTFWAIASTTIGAALHELGHTFSLPHSRHPHDIMTRGIDRLNRFFTFVEPPHARRNKPYEFKDNEVGIWAPVSAVGLWPCRWVALDAREWKGPSKTDFTLDKKALTLNIACPNGIRALVFHKRNAFTHFPVPVNAPAPKQMSIPLGWIGRQLRTDNFRLRVFDAEGHIPALDMRSLLPSPSVRSWRFSPITQPWKDKGRFAPMDEKRLAEIVASAAQAKLVTAKDSFVDFLPRFPRAKRANTAGYAVRKIRVAKPTQVRIYTGSDDALRLWLNGKLIHKALKLRPAAPDQESVAAELKAGENVLVAEVSNGIGGWGLFLRLEDAKKQPLALADDGELKLFADDPATARVRAILRGEQASR